MSKILINETNLTKIGNAIRAVSGSTDLLFPSAMSGAIEGLSAGEGVYAWKRSDADGIVDFIVSDSETEYPESGTGSDGYVYERVSAVLALMFIASNVDATTNVYDITFGNGLYVAATKIGIYYSTDGRTWTQSNVTCLTKQIVYNGSIFVAVTSSYGAYYSTDGRTWTQSNSPSYLRHVIYRNNIWVLAISNNAGATSGIYYSLNGMTWSASNAPLDTVMPIEYNDGLFIAYCGSRPTDFGIQYSTDGKTWTQSNITNLAIVYMAYNGEVYIATAQDYQNGAYVYHDLYSADGKTWSIIASGAGGLGSPSSDGNGLFVASRSGIRYSTDGKIWTLSNITIGYIRTFYDNTIAYTQKCLLYKDGLWVACFGGNLEQPGLYYSEDGKTWNFCLSGEFNLIRNVNGIWFASANSTDNSGIYYSTDGRTWTQSNIITGGNFLCFYGNENIYFAGGTANGLLYAEL